MPRNSTGTYTLPQAPFTPSSVISSSAVNSDLSDIASALTGSVAANGVTPITAPLGNPSGSAAAPGVTFAAFPAIGIFPVSAGILGFAARGVLGMQLNTDRVGTGQDGNQLTYGNTAVLTPVGSILDFGGATAPDGWLLCFGQSLLRASYPELFTVIGTQYGSADSTHFSVPDCRGRTGVGRTDMGGVDAGNITNAGCGIVGTTLGAAGGLQSVTLTTAQMPTHNHTGTTDGQNTTHTHPQDDRNTFVTATAGAQTQIWQGTSTQNTGNASNDHTHTFTTQNTGGGALHTNVQPTIIFNKIIFAGRL